MTTALASLLRAELGLAAQASWASELPALERELAERLRVDVGALPDALRASPDLLRECAGRLTVSETYFFRHAAQLERLAAQVTERLKSSSRSVRVLSAGCATGEEIYSLAIAVVRRAGREALARVRLLGVDVAPLAVEQAAAASYVAWSFRGAPEWLRDGFFSVEEREGEAPRYLLRREIADAVSFSCDDVHAHLRSLEAGSLDALLFRNVSIYLDDDAIERILSQAHRALRPEHGLLVTAPTDRPPPPHLFGRTDLAGVYLKGQSVRPAVTTAPRRAPPPRTDVAAQRAPARRAPARPAPVAPKLRRAEAGADLAHALRAADEGRYDDALAGVNEALLRRVDAPDAYLLRGQILLARSDIGAATEDLRRALFLDARDPVARYWYAFALSVEGRSEAALKQARQVRLQLEKTALEQTELDAASRDLLDAARFLEESLA